MCSNEDLTQPKINKSIYFFKKIDEWIKKMWHIYTMEYYSAIKGNEIEFFVVRWMDLVCHTE